MSVVDDLDREAIIPLALLKPDFHVPGPRRDGILCDIEYVQREVLHVNAILF
jgi:hypothetical protein